MGYESKSTTETNVKVPTGQRRGEPHRPEGIGGLAKQFMKFAGVGIIAFLVDYLCMIAITEAFGIDPVISAGISFIISLIVNYLLSMRFVFERRDDLSRRREFVIFAVLSAIGWVINEICMWAGTDLLGIDYRIVKIGATAIVMVWNFISRKVWLENHGEKENPVPDGTSAKSNMACPVDAEAEA